MQVNETNENKEFTPLIVAFCCNWCSYAGADLAGSRQMSRLFVYHAPAV